MLTVATDNQRASFGYLAWYVKVVGMAAKFTWSFAEEATQLKCVQCRTNIAGTWSLREISLAGTLTDSLAIEAEIGMKLIFKFSWSQSSMQL